MTKTVPPVDYFFNSQGTVENPPEQRTRFMKDAAGDADWVECGKLTDMCHRCPVKLDGADAGKEKRLADNRFPRPPQGG